MRFGTASLVLLKDGVPSSVVFLPVEKTATLGRSSENDVVLNDPGCSRVHAEIQLSDGAWHLRDMSSRNGTNVNDKHVAEDCILKNGDKIQMGHTSLLFCMTDRTDPETPLPAPANPANPLEISRHVSETFANAITQMSKQKELTSHLNRVRDENLELRRRMAQESQIEGDSPEIRQVFSLIEKVAPSTATVLIRGESGVGKELVARAIHFNSPRRDKPLVCMNCAALSESLLESELFGHEKGAFTGATDRKIGKFEAAEGGTLFLDEIAEMAPELQAKFLRVLEGQPFERVGGNKPIKVNVRVIAATNRPLEKEVSEGRFRHDLFFRLNVFEILVPPLRKRQGDVMRLANYFRERFSVQTNQKFTGFSEAAVDRLASFSWPGNVRELKNVIERAVLLGTPPTIQADDILLKAVKTPGGTATMRANGGKVFVARKHGIPDSDTGTMLLTRPGDTPVSGNSEETAVTSDRRHYADTLQYETSSRSTATSAAESTRFVSDMSAPSTPPVPSAEAVESSGEAQETFVPQTLEQMERKLIARTLAHFEWNKSKTAKALGIERATLDRKISRYGLKNQP